MNEQDRLIANRLRRAEGQIRGVIRMLEEGRNCEDIVTQIVAVRAALDRAAGDVVLAHVDECISRLPPEEIPETVGRAVRLLGRLS